MASFVSRISENLSGLTKSQKDVANYFLYHLDKVAFGTVEDLSHIIGVSTATIVRFSREIGYGGFAELQKDAQAAMLSANLPVVQPDKAGGPGDLLYESFQLDQQNLEMTLQALDRRALDEAFELIFGAKRVYVMGMRICRTLSTYAYINWGQLRPNVRLVHNDSSDFAEEVADVREGDVMVAFWVPRFNAVTARVLQYCRKRRAKVVLISSPGFYAASEYCDVLLSCQMKSPSYQNSFVAPVGLINYFTRRMENRLGPSAAERLANLDDILGPDFFVTKVVEK